MISNIKKIGLNSVCKSISKSLLYKFIGAALSFVVMPISINILDVEKYGIWSTILSFVSWFTFFDFGLANGLRKRLTESLSEKNFEKSNKYISTSYAMITIVSIFLIILILIIFPQLNWNSIFNTNNVNNTELLISMLLISICFIINLVLSNINAIFYAFQKPELPGLSNVIMQSIFIILVVIFKDFVRGNLIWISLAYGIGVIVANFILTVIFIKANKNIKISIASVRVKYIKEVMELGLKFFLIQISSLILLTTDNMVITQVLGPEYVMEYSLIYKIFSVITMIHGGIILSALWSRYTKAYSEKQYMFIKNTFIITKKLFILVLIVTILIAIIIVKTPLLTLWSGKVFNVSKSLVIYTAIYTIIVAWNGTFCALLNGLGQINYQLYISIFSSIINIPISIFLANISGVSGVILGSVISLILGVFVLPIQVNNIINNFEE